MENNILLSVVMPKSTGNLSPWQKCTLSQLIFIAMFSRMSKVMVGPSVPLTDQIPKQTMLYIDIIHNPKYNSDN